MDVGDVEEAKEVDVEEAQEVDVEEPEEVDLEEAEEVDDNGTVTWLALGWSGPQVTAGQDDEHLTALFILNSISILPRFLLTSLFFSFHLEGKDFIDAIEYLMDPRDKEKLHCLLSDESWERFVAGAKLSREEADALYADLSQLEALMAVEDKDMPSAEQLHQEIFMKEFPQVKQDLEDRIQQLYALADEVDKVHKDCTIAQVAASSTR
ncbi:hypothetical protein QTO34_017976 [Cnephaeus nilssonii]|uniref:Uncharacterized protein n=1 Tax=Cnephaeus nilssonii TaxID=3371016 RepID=A0AA40I1Z8_CNENI|nr:hypothetical protein QTO34_017976 [Eptesicus nilssonii]